MIQIINDIAASVRNDYYIRQLVVILFIFCVGFLIVSSGMGSDDDEVSLRKYIVCAFPVGMSSVIACGYVMLVLGIAYRGLFMCLMLAIVSVMALIYGYRKKSFGFFKYKIKYLVYTLIAVIVLAMVACSGLIRISVSNDSLYYFWQYPRAIVYYGGLRDQFDNFLTDTGLGASVIGTLPFLFGFGENFGIQEFFHMSFLAFFGNTVYENSQIVLKGDRKKSIVAAVFGMLILAVCTPAVILSHWAMSNMYFMEIYFICLAFALEYARDKSINRNLVLALLVFAVSVIRVEGGIFVLFLILAASLRDIKGKDLVLCILPVVVMQSLYEIRIFTGFTIDHPYTFLTIGKSILQFVAYIAAAGYVLLIRDKIKDKLGKNMAVVIISGLLLVNLVLLVQDSAHYVANLRAFAGNLTGQSGWGILPHITLGVMVVIVCLEAIDNRFSLQRLAELTRADSNILAYWIFNTIGFLLVTLAVSFARGDNLNVDTGDSGNRVLLQIAPIVLITLFVWIIDNIQRKEEKDV